MSDGKAMDTFEALARTEIGFIRDQSGWLFAFGSGLADFAPHAADRLRRQATFYSDEAAAAERRLQEIISPAASPPAGPLHKP